MNSQLFKMITMGNRITKPSISGLRHSRDYVSEAQLRTIAIVVSHLKTNVRHRQIFTATGFHRHVRQVALYITAGCTNIREILAQRSAVEVAAGLQYFLVHLPKPLLPQYIQTLGLDINDAIQPEVVASDILGLISQDIKSRHLLLISMLLDLLFYVRLFIVNNELGGSAIPITMLPVFFNLEFQHLSKWRSIASVFMEMINLSPTVLPVTDYDYLNEINQNIQVQQDLNLNVHPAIHLQNNAVFRQYLARTDHRGDGNFPEIVHVFGDRVDPRMINNIFGYFVRRFG